MNHVHELIEERINELGAVVKYLESQHDEHMEKAREHAGKASALLSAANEIEKWKDELEQHLEKDKSIGVEVKA